MSRQVAAPSGLVGLDPRESIGVAVAVGRRGASGAPILKDRFWFMSPQAHSAEFGAGGKTYRSLTRDPHPAFKAWNDAAGEQAKQKSGGGEVGRFATVRGVIDHAALADAVLWNRAAQKLPEPHPNPPSMRPACEGDGVRAVRYGGKVADREVYDQIACPNSECIFAMSRLCKPSVHLTFMLRWDASDPFEAQFPALRAKWTSRSWNSLANLLGMFEHVLGTRAVAPWKPEEEWRPGLAAEFGIAAPSLVGLPFVMTVSEKTKPADAKSAQGKRFPVVSFSPDGDLGDWLLAQGRRRRELVALGREALSLPAPSVRDAEFVELARHADRLEVEGAPLAADPAPAATDALPTLSASDVEALAAGLRATGRWSEEDLLLAAGLEGVRSLSAAPAESLPRLREILAGWVEDR